MNIPFLDLKPVNAPYEEELKIIEVQKGSYISEDDIIRYEDAYGRV